ncbi:hypothetical protein LCGC14_0636800, partial [marine sediment metagenome]
MEVFLKRAERPFKAKIGEAKTQSTFDNIRKATNEIPAKFRRTIGSEIPRYLFTFSQEIDSLSPEIIEGVLDHILIFAESLKDLLNKDRNQVSQLLTKRSDNKVRSLSDLLNFFVEKAKNQDFLKNPGSFENLLTYLFGDKTEIHQLTEVELFIKRAEKNFSQIYGEVKSREYSENIKKALSGVDPNLQDYINSEIPKYLFTLSQNVENLSNDTIERRTINIIPFLRAISNVDGKNKEEINQIIIKRSENKLFNLIDLFNAFLGDAKEGNELESCDNLEDILLHLLGEEKARMQFSDIEAFLKRAEKKY